MSSATPPAIPPPPGGAPASWDGTAWVSGDLVFSGSAWVARGSAPDPTARLTAWTARMTFLHKAVAVCVVLAIALGVGALCFAVGGWFGSSGEGTDYGSPARLCLVAAAALLGLALLLVAVLAIRGSWRARGSR